MTGKPKYRHNFLLLVYVHLLLFVFPTVDKAIHQHEHDETGNYGAETGRHALGQPKEDCPVCDFHFYHFTHTPTPEICVCPAGYSAIRVMPVSGSFVSTPLYVLLRAPPAVLCMAS